MEKKSKTCFVISPIGKEGTDIRKNSDDLLELIIMPALEIYNFDVIRGDKLSLVSTITDDIIRLIQDSELCIIDLTAQNPNVFYECGRRHETARPYIHIKKKDEAIPFDIAGIRTIEYDLSDGRKIRDSIQMLRKFIGELELSGYSSQSSSSTLNSLASTLSRIERKIDLLDKGKEIPGSFTSNVEGSPLDVFYEAIVKKEYTRATAALNKFMKINFDVNKHLNLACILLEEYEPESLIIVKRLMEKNFDQLSETNLYIALDDLYRYALGADSLNSEDKNFIYKYIDKTLERNLEDEIKAQILYIKSSVEYSLGNDKQSIDYAKKCIEVNEKPVYNFMVAFAYYNLKDSNNSLKYLDKAIELNNESVKIDLKSLQRALNIYQEFGKIDKVEIVQKMIEDYIKKGESKGPLSKEK
jgi:tetratricopeptide (TPR) repeat protein